MEKWKFEQDIANLGIQLDVNSILDLYQYVDELIKDEVEARVEAEVESRVEAEVDEQADEARTEYEAEISSLEKRVAVYNDFLKQMQGISATDTVHIYWTMENGEFKIAVERIGE